MHCRICEAVGNAPSWALFLLFSLSMLMMAFSVSGIILLAAG
ncbi:MAG: hypothetical protein AABX74_06550 [Nanoarchaeota archaeon]